MVENDHPQNEQDAQKLKSYVACLYVSLKYNQVSDPVVGVSNQDIEDRGVRKCRVVRELMKETQVSARVQGFPEVVGSELGKENRGRGNQKNPIKKEVLKSKFPR